MKKLIIVCATIVLLAGIGAWVYVQKQNINQRNTAQQLDRANDIKKLKYQECQTNNRAADSEIKTNPFAGLGVKNCDLIL